MNPNIWICIEEGVTKYLRPCNHSNCESAFHAAYEHEARRKMVKAPDYCKIGKLYDITKIRAPKRLSESQKFQKNIKGETKSIKRWLMEIDKYSKLPDDEYKFKQINNAVSAIYTGYNTLGEIVRSYKP